MSTPIFNERLKANLPVAPEIRDIRELIPRADWSIGRRDGAPRYITLHYNGPTVMNRTPKGEVNQLIGDAKWQMRPGGLGAKNGGDGLQYHYVVLSDGTIHQTRDEGDVLWHCGNSVGNQWSLSVHLPLGGQQDATEPQWEATLRLFGWLASKHLIPVQRVLGHKEWKSTACPGPFLFPRLLRWRDAAPATVIAATFAAQHDVGIYEGPGMTFPIALGSSAVMKKGDEFQADAVLVGQRYNSDVRWFHRADGVGFVPWTTVRQVG
ncbi:N-acetylmuramoyl-L-alanine amidase [Oscillochloris sp. ZM17-4]|uniref:peptidoglycan recognition protein family protein n=1 Tax=Oscillochloris sp. ZM17-4 TaxID=2866714 RepID=UPI001C736FE9|nr:peptidoglycan recognition family protein [Oscillochloris sp. ZM17-4]MBX0328698.1 N-acetylmuramoyl-L-alanine amidase [Oscillochloris sp. ZM17-4]